jgi:hypothetical protein
MFGSLEMALFAMALAAGFGIAGLLFPLPILPMTWWTDQIKEMYIRAYTEAADREQPIAALEGR